MKRGEDSTGTIYMQKGGVDCSVGDRGMHEDVATPERPDRIGISAQVRWSFDRNVGVEREPEKIRRGREGAAGTYTPPLDG